MLNNKYIVFGLAVFLFSNISKANQTNFAITNGRNTSDYPNVGMLRTSHNLCTATLIGQKTVLTAGHCVNSNPNTAYTFVLNGISYEIKSIIVHLEFKMNGHLDDNNLPINDIAIAFLYKSPSVQPAIVSNVKPDLDEKITLVGFGITSEKVHDYGIKRVTNNVISKIYDSKRFTFEGNGNLYGAEVGNTCYGDSGGPAFSTINNQEVIVGITSGGLGACGIEGWDTDVSAFYCWINETTNGDLAKLDNIEIIDDSQFDNEGGCSISGSSSNFSCFGFMIITFVIVRIWTRK